MIAFADHDRKTHHTGRPSDLVREIKNEIALDLRRRMAIAARRGRELSIRQLPANLIDHRGVMSLAVGVHTTSDLPRCCRHAETVVLSVAPRGGTRRSGGRTRQ